MQYYICHSVVVCWMHVTHTVLCVSAWSPPEPRMSRIEREAALVIPWRDVNIAALLLCLRSPVMARLAQAAQVGERVGAARCPWRDVVHVRRPARAARHGAAEPVTLQCSKTERAPASREVKPIGHFSFFFRRGGVRQH